MKLNYLFVALVLPGFVWAQTPEKNKEVKQIVITKKSGASEKLNIIIDGDKVTVNGDPLDKSDKNANITVTRRKIKDMDVWMDDGAPGKRRIIRRHAFGPQGQPAVTEPNRAMLGVATTKADDGVKVMSVTKGSAADIAGLKEGDIIVELDRNKIEKPDDLSELIKDKNPGDKVTIGYIRDNKQRTAVAELKKWEFPTLPELGNFDVPGFNVDEFRNRMGELRDRRNNIQLDYNFGLPARAKLGIKIQDLDKGAGVRILEVEEGSDAARAGLKAGDTIKKVNGKEIAGADDMRSKVFGVKPGDNLSVELVRNGKTQNVNIQLSKKIKTAEL